MGTTRSDRPGHTSRRSVAATKPVRGGGLHAAESLWRRLGYDNNINGRDVIIDVCAGGVAEP